MARAGTPRPPETTSVASVLSRSRLAVVGVLDHDQLWPLVWREHLQALGQRRRLELAIALGVGGLDHLDGSSPGVDARPPALSNPSRAVRDSSALATCCARDADVPMLGPCAARAAEHGAGSSRGDA